MIRICLGCALVAASLVIGALSIAPQPANAAPVMVTTPGR